MMIIYLAILFALIVLTTGWHYKRTGTFLPPWWRILALALLGIAAIRLGHAWAGAVIVPLIIWQVWALWRARQTTYQQWKSKHGDKADIVDEDEK